MKHARTVVGLRYHRRVVLLLVFIISAMSGLILAMVDK